MNRIYLCIAGIFALFYACSNNLETIGQDIVDNNNYIATEEVTVLNTATIRLDSFITSSSVYGGTEDAPKYVLAGKYNEPYGGTTTAIPCFQLDMPANGGAYISSIEAVLDSAIFCVHLGDGIWGDTAYHPQIQRYDIYRLKEVPQLIYESGTRSYFYNTSLVNYDENAKIAELSFLPRQAYINDSWARIDDELAQSMFEEMKYATDPSSYYYNAEKFRDFFKGLAIVPRANNNCIISLNAQDSVYIDFYYKQGSSNESSIKRFPISRSEYLYNTYQTDRSNTLLAPLKTQQDEVYFEETGFAISQGLAGYAVSFTLPPTIGMPRYSTLLKVQLEVTVQYAEDTDIKQPTYLNLYRVGEENDFLGALSTSDGTAITGLPQTTNNANERDYIFDMTEYYQNIIDANSVFPQIDVAIMVPNVSLSYDYIIVKKEPVIRFYYAKYK